MNSKLSAFVGACAALAIAGLSVPAAAAPPVPNDPSLLVFPAGIACDFGLQIEGAGDGHQKVKEFKDGVRTISTGTGRSLTWTNTDTDATYFSKSNGTNTTTRSNPDGSTTMTFTGHNGIVMYPTDLPPGPSTTLYSGQVVVNIDSAGNWTIEKESGKKIDICAQLSS